LAAPHGGSGETVGVTEQKTNSWFSRGGSSPKYVIALVGIFPCVFVLAGVNGEWTKKKTCGNSFNRAPQGTHGLGTEPAKLGAKKRGAEANPHGGSKRLDFPSGGQESSWVGKTPRGPSRHYAKTRGGDNQPGTMRTKKKTPKLRRGLGSKLP